MTKGKYLEYSTLPSRHLIGGVTQKSNIESSSTSEPHLGEKSSHSNFLPNNSCHNAFSITGIYLDFHCFLSLSLAQVSLTGFCIFRASGHIFSIFQDAFLDPLVSNLCQIGLAHVKCKADTIMTKNKDTDIILCVVTEAVYARLQIILGSIQALIV